MLESEKRELVNVNTLRLEKKELTQMGLSTLSTQQEKRFNFFKHQKWGMKKSGASIYFYNMHSQAAKDAHLTEKQLVALAKNKVNGYLSEKSVKRIVGTFKLWHEAIEYYNENIKQKNKRRPKHLNMITLTLPTTIAREDIWMKRRLLTPFLQKMMYYRPTMNYLWKMEKKVKYQPHFHVIVDEWMDKEVIRDLWYDTVNAQIAVWQLEDKWGHVWNNGTRVEGLRDKTSAAAYVAKYMSKKEDDLPCTGRIWGCNRELSQLKPTNYIVYRTLAMTVIDNLKRDLQEVFITDQYMRVTFNRDYHDLKYIAINQQEVNAIKYSNWDILNRTDLFPFGRIFDADWCQSDWLHIHETVGSIYETFAPPFQEPHYDGWSYPTF